MSPLRVTGDAFHSTRMSGLNFQQLPRERMEQHFPKFPKQGNLTRYTQIFEIFSPKFFIHSTLLLENLEFSVEWFAFWKFNRFFFNLERAYSLWFACGGQLKRSRKWGRGLLPSSHFDLSAMPIMFITPSSLPVA